MERNHLSPTDFYRYSVTGAHILFEQASFEIALTRKIGNTHTATVATLGFGVGDFEQLESEREALNRSHRSLDILKGRDFRHTAGDPQNWLYHRAPAVG